MSPDGAFVYVTGYSFGRGSDLDYATIAYDASSGSRRWVSRYNGPGNGGDSAYGLGVAPDGSQVYVTGYSLGSGGVTEIATVAYEASNGTRLWVRRYDSVAGLGALALSLAVDPLGSAVFVAGGTEGSTSGSDYATVAYSTT